MRWVTTIKPSVGLLISAVCIAAPQAAIWRLQEKDHLDTIRAEKFDVRNLPMVLGRWKGTPSELDPRIFQRLGASSAVDRTYENGIGTVLSVHAASFAPEVIFPHSPTLCYSSAGFTIVEDEWHKDSDGRRYRWMIAERSHARVGVVYWYQIGSESVSNRDELRRVLQNLRREGRERPALIKVLVQVPVAFGADESRRNVEDLVAPICDWIKEHS